MNIKADISPEDPLPSRPLVFLLLDGWGIAASSEANAISSAKLPFLDILIKEFPVALLSSSNKNLNSRYLSIGSGRDLDDENIEVTITLTKILADLNKKQIKITETERLAALTYFFSGHKEHKLMGEEWHIVSSNTGDNNLKPSLALNQICRELITSLKTEKYDFLAVAIPTLDLVARTGNFKAVIKAAEDIDKNLRKIVATVLDKKGVIIISSACGNAENMKSMATEVINSEMTTNPVPLIIIGDDFKGKTIGLDEPLNNDLSLLSPAGNFNDVVPTILDIMNIAKPEEMNGNSILTKI